MYGCDVDIVVVVVCVLGWVGSWVLCVVVDGCCCCVLCVLLLLCVVCFCCVCGVVLVIRGRVV